MSETIETEAFENQKSGGGCGKVLLWLFLIALILSCLCCAGFVGVGYHVVNSLKKGLVDDPVLAQQKTEDAFGELNLPDCIKPHALFNLRFFGKDLGFAGIYSWNVANVPASAEPAPESEASKTESKLDEDSKENENDSKDDNDKGFILFYSLSDVLKAHEKELVKGISEGITQNKNKNVTVKKTETASVTINGTPNDFTFSWMENEEKQTFLMVSGSFTAKTNETCNVMIYLPGEPSQEIVTEVLENIQK